MSLGDTGPKTDEEKNPEKFSLQGTFPSGRAQSLWNSKLLQTLTVLSLGMISE